MQCNLIVFLVPCMSKAGDLRSHYRVLFQDVCALWNICDMPVKLRNMNSARFFVFPQWLLPSMCTSDIPLFSLAVKEQ